MWIVFDKWTSFSIPSRWSIPENTKYQWPYLTWGIETKHALNDHGVLRRWWHQHVDERYIHGYDDCSQLHYFTSSQNAIGPGPPSDTSTHQHTKLCSQEGLVRARIIRERIRNMINSCGFVWETSLKSQPHQNSKAEVQTFNQMTPVIMRWLAHSFIFQDKTVMIRLWNVYLQQLTCRRQLRSISLLFQLAACPSPFEYKI